MTYTKKHVGLWNIFGSALGALLLTYAIWQQFEAQVLMFFVILLAISEVFIQVRWRINIVCKFCGFDPVLYLKDAELAAAKVKEFLERRKENPLRTPLNLPTITKKRSEEIEAIKAEVKSIESNRPRILSKQI